MALGATEAGAGKRDAPGRAHGRCFFRVLTSGRMSAGCGVRLLTTDTFEPGQLHDDFHSTAFQQRRLARHRRVALVQAGPLRSSPSSTVPRRRVGRRCGGIEPGRLRSRSHRRTTSESREAMRSTSSVGTISTFATSKRAKGFIRSRSMPTCKSAAVFPPPGAPPNRINRPGRTSKVVNGSGS